MLNNLKEDDQFEGINYLLISINGFKKSIKWYSKMDSKQAAKLSNNNTSTSVVPVANQCSVPANLLKRKYGVSFVKFLSNCRSVFEPNISDIHHPAENTINDKLMLLKSSQVTEIIQHMFDGVSSNSVISIPKILGKSVAPPPAAICDSPFTAVTCKQELVEVKEEETIGDNIDDAIGVEKIEEEVITKQNQEIVPAPELMFKRIKREIKEEDGTMSTASDAAEADADDLADDTDGQHVFEDSLDQITSSVSVASDFESLSTKKVRLKSPKKEMDMDATESVADADNEDDKTEEKVATPKPKRKKVTFSCFQCVKRYKFFFGMVLSN